MYKIIGQDGKEYGPVSVEQLRHWIAQGRANAQTRVLPEGANEWKLLAAIPELAALFPAQIPPTISAFAPQRKHNEFAIMGMVCGLLSLLTCSKILMGMLGIIFSLVALSKINREPERYEGRAMAIAGIILSVLGLLFVLVVIIFSLAAGNLHILANWHIQ